MDWTGLDDAYLADRAKAREKAGTDEAVITGRARIRGHDVALIVGEFRFLGGSIGQATSERIIAAVRRATEERLPLISATSSGGTRMQEGTPAFVKMVDVSRAVVAHKAAGLPYLVYLRHPTTGGVFASWGSLGHISVAEPGALIGFLGPAVYQALHNEPFPEGVQFAENLVKKGIIDAVVKPKDLAEVAARALNLLGSSTEPDLDPSAPVELQPDADAWQSIQLTRRPDRPGVRELLRHAASDEIPLNGTQEGESGEALFTAAHVLPGCVLCAARPGPPHPADPDTARPSGTAHCSTGDGNRRTASSTTRMCHRHARSRPVRRSRRGGAGRRDRPLPGRHGPVDGAQRLHPAG